MTFVFSPKRVAMCKGISPVLFASIDCRASGQKDLDRRLVFFDDGVLEQGLAGAENAKVRVPGFVPLIGIGAAFQECLQRGRVAQSKKHHRHTLSVGATCVRFGFCEQFDGLRLMRPDRQEQRRPGVAPFSMAENVPPHGPSGIRVCARRQ